MTKYEKKLVCLLKQKNKLFDSISKIIDEQLSSSNKQFAIIKGQLLGYANVLALMVDYTSQLTQLELADKDQNVKIDAMIGKKHTTMIAKHIKEQYNEIEITLHRIEGESNALHKLQDRIKEFKSAQDNMLQVDR